MNDEMKAFLKNRRAPSYARPETIEECHELIVELMRDADQQREDTWSKEDVRREGWATGYASGLRTGRNDGKWLFLGKLFRAIDEPDLADYCERSLDW